MSKIVINNVTYRNLEEQVQYLTDRIGDATDVVKVVKGILQTYPTSTTGYVLGDTVAVGTGYPYSYWVLT